MKNLAARFVRAALLAGAGAVIAITPLFAPGASAETARIDEYKLLAREGALCKKMTASIRALPRSTLLEDWPAQIEMRGLTRPHWVNDDPLRNIELIKRSYAYLGGRTLYEPGSTGDPTVWPQVEDRVLKSIRDGSMKFESATIDLSGPGTRTKLYRFSTAFPSMGTLGGGRADGAIRPTWGYIIGATEQEPALHDWPLYPFYPFLDVLIIDDVAYFPSLPDGGMLRLVLFPPYANPVPLPGIVPVCDFRLSERSKK